MPQRKAPARPNYGPALCTIVELHGAGIVLPGTLYTSTRTGTLRANAGITLPVLQLSIFIFCHKYQY
jgi:hypothetical protein